MTLLKINGASVINVDAIASINAGNDEQSNEFVCCVRYAVRGKDDVENGLASEVFVGDDAVALYKYLTDPSRCVDLPSWMERNCKPDVTV